MARSNFENLRVYQLAEVLADEIWEIALKWNNFARDTVGKQIVRAADSISANIAEAMDAAVTKTTDDSSASHEVR